jgi:hypothetical protein
MRRLDSIFDVKYGHSLELNRLEIVGADVGIPFVSRKMKDNGVAAYVKPVAGIEPYKAGELTCALSGNGVLSTFIQERPYYTAFHVACLRPKEHLSVSQMLFYSLCIRANRYRYSYGRQANRTLKELLLPSSTDIPSWIDQVPLDQMAGAESQLLEEDTPKISLKTWKEFKIGELFEVKKGKRLTKGNMKPGDTPFIGAVDNNNGLTNFVDKAAIHDANTITVNYNGNGVAEAFYQRAPYWCSDDVNVLYPKFNMNAYVALFIATIIRREKYRFSYGRKWHLQRMESAVIKLPATVSGQPDWNLMSTYIQTLPYSSSIN